VESVFIALPGKAENLPLMLPRDFFRSVR